MKFLLSRLLISAAALAAGGCTIFDPKPPMNIADPLAVVPADFLFSRYEPLNDWLDQAVRVQIFDVPLMETFNTPALRGPQYAVVIPPLENPLIFIDKAALTRRQLLWSLAQDHQLHLTPVFSPNGGPAWIEIRSRQISRDAEAQMTTEPGDKIRNSNKKPVE